MTTALRSCLIGALALLATPVLAACGDDTDPPGGGGAGGEDQGGAGGATGGAGGAGGAPQPIVLTPEAGFIEVPATTGGPDYTSRLFYSFIPAEHDADKAPIVLFFNGGPGAATTSVLLPFGTGPLTIDPAAAPDVGPAENPNRWSRFANLLYVDTRSAGLSYDLEPGLALTCSPTGYMPAIDAGDFIYALLEFLDSHEPLRDNPVVVSGESYGGTRAPLMLYMLQYYGTTPESPSPSDPDIAAAAPWLRDKMQAHLDAAFPEDGTGVRDAGQVAKQFGWQILIQPSIFGLDQSMFQQQYLEQDPDFAEYFANPSTYSPYDVRLTNDEAALIGEHADNTIRNPQFLAALLGVGLDTITGLAAADRADAYRDLSLYDVNNVANAESAMREALGDLPMDRDAYYLPLASPCGFYLGDYMSLQAFARVMVRGGTFITNARHDAVVYTEALPIFFQQASSFTVDVDTSVPAGSPRKGVIRLHGDLLDVDLRFPTYDAGHEVSIGAPAEFAQDVELWLGEQGLLP
ncbi:MAG: hypothetical protein U0271_46765 [Polyangiaceae bacterium]